ncbi:MAG: hypothetical protein FWH20_09095 [Oscillospiraceae bacterium]|nr:hypothetical protein [Oscillospiraceae bacterium]
MKKLIPIIVIIAFILIGGIIVAILPETVVQWFALLAGGIIGALFVVFWFLKMLDRYKERIRSERFNETKTKIMKNSDENMAVFQSFIAHENAQLAANLSKNNTKIKDINQKLEEKEKQYEELKTEVREALIKQRGQKNILELMFDNMEEIRDYFSISKRHAKLSFWLAIINCLVGVVLLSLSVYYALTNPSVTPAVIAASAGAVSELFAATSLVVHQKSLTQLNHYYNALHNNEMFLSTVNLVSNLTLDKQDDILIEIIRNELKVRLNKVATKN